MNRYGNIYDTNLVELLDFINSQGDMRLISIFKDDMEYYVAIVEIKNCRG